MEKTIEVTEISFTKKGAKKLKTNEGSFYIQSKDFNNAQISNVGTYSVYYEPSTFDGKTFNWVKRLVGGAGMASNQAQSPVSSTNGNGIGDRARQDGIGRSVALNNACLMVDSFARAWASCESVKNRTPEDIQDMLRSLKESQYRDNLGLLGITPNEIEDQIGM